jgi:hypothetical protein
MAVPRSSDPASAMPEWETRISSVSEIMNWV